MILAELVPRAIRQFTREPLYAFASAGTLALAVAAAVTSFAVVKPAFSIRFRTGADMSWCRSLTQVGTARRQPSRRTCCAISKLPAPPLTEFASIRPAGVTFTGDDATINVPTNVVTASYFSLLGVAPAMGRFFTDAEPEAVVISWRFWQSTLDRRCRTCWAAAFASTGAIARWSA